MDKLQIYLEVQGMAEDESGNPCPAGMRITLEGELKKEVDYAELTKDMDILSLLEFAHMEKFIKPEDVRIISPEEYNEKYSD